MKKNSLLLILLTVLFMGANAQKLEIEGTFKGINNATVKVLNNSYQEIGKTTFEDGMFNLPVDVKEIEIGKESLFTQN